MVSIHDDDYFAPVLTGYERVSSASGRLYCLPLTLHQTTHLQENPVPSVFRSRQGRPHRIRITRIAPEYRSRDVEYRKRVSTVISGKLAWPRDSARRILKSLLSAQNPQDPSKPDRPLSSPSVGNTDNIGLGRRPASGVWEGKRRTTLEAMRPNLRHSVAGPISGAIARSSFSDERSASPVKNIISADISHRIPDEKPLASGNGVSISIALAEPVLFLQGFDHGDLQANRSTAMLRGSFHLKVSKPAKIKAVTLRFRGRAITKWPEGIPPKKADFEETTTQMSHTWPFFNAQFPTAEHGTGADHIELHRTSTDVQVKTRSSLDMASPSPASTSNTNLTSKELKRLSLQANQSRSFGNGETQPGGPSIAQKGYRTFNPGDYIYNFELPIDSHLPETIDVELGTVKYELEAIVERAGAFKANLMGTKEVVMIRTPAEGSLEQVEPIAISRNWEDQMHYDIVISGKSFPLGSQVPIAFKLTPLAKVQCQRIKVFLTESVEYFCHNKRVHRMEPTRKVQLFEKRADGPATSTFPGSTMRIVSGGGVPYDLRAAAARGENIPPPDPTNLLGNLDGDRNVGPTEMEFNIQLPSCLSMKDKDKSLKLHFDTTYQNIQVHHWIKIVMRLSRIDENDPTKRRHFEISIDSPFHILSCRATQANTSLPAYSSPETGPSDARLYECGCPGSPLRRNSPNSYVPTLNNLSQARSHVNSCSSNSTDLTPSTTASNTFSSNRPPSSDDASPQRPLSRIITAGLTRPAAAHTEGPFAQARPMHIIRSPSFLPPSFDSDDPPPPLETPPPQYADIASPSSGLADYFARLAERYDRDGEESDDDGDDGEDGDGRSTPRGRGRVEIPLTPGSTRTTRSMDVQRNWMPIGVVESTGAATVTESAAGTV